MSCTTGFVARSLIPDLLKIVGVSASVFLGSAALSGAIARADGVDEAGRIADILFDAQPSQPGLLYPDDETVTAMSEALAELGHEPSAETAFALRLLAQGDARPILTVLEERLAQDPDDEDALFDQGAVYGAYAPRKMLEAYGRALKLDATNVLAWARVFENRLFAGDTDGWKAALAALETLAASDPQARRVVAWKSCRADYQRNQNFENAESECRTAIAAAREANDWTVIGGASADLAYVLLELGRASEAREVAANVADELEAAGQPRAVLGPLGILSQVIFSTDSADTVDAMRLSIARRELAAYRKLGYARGQARTLVEISQGLYDATDEQLANLSEAAALYRRINAPIDAARVEMMRGEVLESLGQYADAAKAYDESALTFQDNSDYENLVRALVALYGALRDGDDRTRITQVLKQAENYMLSIRTNALEQQVMFARAEALQFDGRYAEAHDYLIRALDTCNTNEWFCRAPTLHRLGEVAAASGATSEACSYLADAIAAYEKLPNRKPIIDKIRARRQELDCEP